MNTATRTVTVTSGKGGVGKTSICINLALHLSALGRRTCLFDADLGLANVNILLGLDPEYTLKDVIMGGRSLEDIIIRDHRGLDILPGSSGVEEMADLDAGRMEGLTAGFSGISGYDFLLFDTSAGISRNVLSFCLASSEVLVVITPEPTSLTDAFALIKVLSLNGFAGRARVIINQCRDVASARRVYKKFGRAVAKYIGMEILPLGVVYSDEKVTEAVKRQEALVSIYPEAAASRCIRKIAERLSTDSTAPLEGFDPEGFWSRWFELMGGSFNLGGDRARKKERGPQSGPSSKGPDRGGSEVPGEIKSVDAGPFSGAPLSMIEKAVESLSSISMELSLVRKALEGNGRIPLKEDSRGEIPEKHRRPKAIRLDPQAFLERRGHNGKVSSL
jgi:flagellar biosynthesis protein FlhG